MRPFWWGMAVACLTTGCGGRIASSELVDEAGASGPCAVDKDYFYCHIEPQYLFAYRCGPGDPSKGDPPNGCHSGPSAGWSVFVHPPVDCGGGDHPIDPTAIGMGSPAENDYASLSLSRVVQGCDYKTWPLYVRPAGTLHPRQVIDPNDPTVVMLLRTWAGQ